MEFLNIAAALAKFTILKESVYDSLIAAGINWMDWPKCFPREVMEKFSVDRKEGFQYASWQANKSTVFDQLELMIGRYSFPQELAPVRVEYFKLLEREKLMRLSRDIEADPEKGAELVREFMMHASSGVDIDVVSEADVWFGDERQELIEDGRMKVMLPNWPILSNKIGGFNPERLGILIARTGFGKTNLGAQWCLDASTTIPALYFNMEMSKYDFMSRLFASLTNSTADYMATSAWPIQIAMARAKERKMFFTSGRGLTLTQIKAVTRKYAQQHGVKFVVFDYDQKITLPGKDDEWKELQLAAMELEELCKECGIFGLLLAQSDEDGRFAASKRATQPASTVMVFDEDRTNGIHIRVVKNRFGPRFAAIKVDYRPAESFVKELESFIWTAPQQNVFRKSAKPTSKPK